MRLPALNAVDQPRLRQIALIIDVAAKVGPVMLLIIAVANPDLGIRDSPELSSGYTDTLGDLSLGSLGSLVAGITAYALWRRGTLRTSPHRA